MSPNLFFFFLSFSKIFILAYYRDLERIFRSPRSVIVGHCRSFLVFVTTAKENQAAMSSPRWRPPYLEFQATLDENFIGLESSLETEISVSNLPLYNLFVGEKKKPAILE